MKRKLLKKLLKFFARSFTAALIPGLALSIVLIILYFLSSLALMVTWNAFANTFDLPTLSYGVACLMNLGVTLLIPYILLLKWVLPKRAK